MLCGMTSASWLGNRRFPSVGCFLVCPLSVPIVGMRQLSPTALLPETILELAVIRNEPDARGRVKSQFGILDNRDHFIQKPLRQMAEATAVIECEGDLIVNYPVRGLANSSPLH